MSGDMYALECRKKFDVENIFYERMIIYQQTNKLSGGMKKEKQRIRRQAKCFEWDAKG